MDTDGVVLVAFLKLKETDTTVSSHADMTETKTYDTRYTNGKEWRDGQKRRKEEQKWGNEVERTIGVLRSK